MKTKYFYTVTALTFSNHYNADTENTYNFVDIKDDLTDRQIVNRIKKHYDITNNDLRISRTQVNIYA